VTDNTIYDNKGLGIFLYDSGSFNIFGNYLGANEWGNAKDIAGECTSLDTNLWDDDVSLGNEWDDYEGTGVYPIPGNRDSVDRYPIGSTPATDASGISYYWISDTNNFIVDNVDYPGTITWSEPLAIGEYPLEVRAYDQFDNFCSATITVTVQDTVCPEIVGPLDVTYKEGETGNTLVWSVSDLNPSTYEIYQDGVPIIEDSWVDSSIEISIDGLLPDTYVYRIEVYDLGGNSASDEVTVEVEPEKIPIPTTTTTIIPKPKTNTDLDAPSDDSMGAPVVEPAVVATGIIAPTILGITILFILGRKREVA
jgi:parallel beta-helix repeat protein